MNEIVAPGSPAGVAPPQAAAYAAQRFVAAPAQGSWRPARNVLVLGALLLAGLAIAGVAYAMHESRMANGLSGKQGDRTYDYYHDQYFDSDSYSPQFDRSSIVDRADRWQYNGPYTYGNYGSKAMRDRAKGKGVDPLAGGAEPLANVFDLYGNADPSGGRPVGDRWAAWTDPTYDPYSGYSNPYANRIRMAWGPGYERAVSQER